MPALQSVGSFALPAASLLRTLSRNVHPLLDHIHLHPTVSHSTCSLLSRDGIARRISHARPLLVSSLQLVRDHPVYGDTHSSLLSLTIPFRTSRPTTSTHTSTCALSLIAIHSSHHHYLCLSLVGATPAPITVRVCQLKYTSPPKRTIRTRKSISQPTSHVGPSRYADDAGNRWKIPIEKSMQIASSTSLTLP